jgi:hypothetical protein
MNTTTAAATLRTTDELTHHYVSGGINGYPTPSKGEFYERLITITTGGKKPKSQYITKVTLL